MTDTIADMLTRIRNALVAKHETVDVPASSIKKVVFGGTRVLDDICRDMTKLETVEILNGVTSIGKYAFETCSRNVFRNPKQPKPIRNNQT